MRKKKILLVDDEPQFVDMVKMRLEAYDYNVITAYNGKEALVKAGIEKPDLILLDILMPVMDGYTAIKELRKKEETKDIPVIVLTAKAGMKDLFTSEGITEYINKPFEDEGLLLKIKKAIK